MMKIGKYEVLEEIGRGAMGVVYKAFDPLISRIVAIKVISESALAMPEIKERFYREARSVGKLNHENITIVHDVGEVEGKPYLVMEYLAGTDLKSIIHEKTRVPFLQKLEYARQICKGLLFAHSQNIIHRDIKPENIKLLSDGKIKIMDFGIARPTASELTTSGMMLGTPSYMSPEQIKGKTIDTRSDIFSFGVLLFELLMYQKPFGETASTVIFSVLHNEPAPVDLKESSLVAEVQNLLDKCLAKNAGDRYRDCAMLLQDLETIIAKRREEEQKIAGLLVQARAVFAQRKFQEALPLLTEVLRMDSTSEEAESLRQQCVEDTHDTTITPVTFPATTGTIASRYKIVARLGAGGMGVVYKAEDTRLKRLVALKFLSPHLTTDLVAKERFIREAQAASALDHPNICTIYEIDETAASPDLQFAEGAGQLFICMAYYEGQTLKEKMADGALPLDLTTALTVQIAQGLAKAHDNGIVHRDIKPANVMITKDGLVKILDFGLAKLSGETRLTRSGMTAGTLGYVSPEQAQNREVDHRSDIWSLGVMLYQMATGKLPFEGDYELAILYAIVHENPVPAAQLNSDIPAELEQVISRALQKPVDARFASMQGMLENLKQVQRRYYRGKEHESVPLREEVGNLITKGKFLLEKNEYPQALSRFRAALTLDNKNTEVADLIAACERKQREQQQISKWLDTAKKQFEKGAYPNALVAVQNILALEPNHYAAKDWEKRIQHSQEKAERVEKLFSDADFYVRKEKFVQAREAYQEILQLVPGSKNATRGWKRAEQALQNRKPEAAPSHRTQLEPLEQTRVLPAARERIPSKGLWAGLVATLLLAVVGAWFLWLRPQPQAVQQGDAGPDFSQRAATAKLEMLQAKAEAQQAAAERWAPDAYQQAVQEEHRGESEFSQGNFAFAWQAYNAAVEQFRNTAAEARRIAELATANLNELKNESAQMLQAMLKEKTLADNAGAKTKARKLFNEALLREEQGHKSHARDDREGYLAARQAFAAARDGYRKATEETAFAKLAEEAEAARKEMARAKQQFSGSEENQHTNSNYRKALALESDANRQFAAGAFPQARDLFAQARDFYAAATKEVAKTAGRSAADAAKVTMLEARARVEKDASGETRYREAERIRNEADKEYNEADFESATRKYQTAETSYVAVALENQARVNRERDKMEAARQSIEALIVDFEQRLERKDFNGFKALFKNFKPYDEFWSTFFKHARDIKVAIDTKDIRPGGNQAQVDIEMNIDYYDANLGKSENKTMGPSSWVLELINGRWVIVKLW